MTGRDWQRALACDQAVSQVQLAKLYSVTQAQALAAGIPSTRRSIAATKASRPCQVRFFVADKRLLKQPSATLRHLAGVAELRAQLGAEPNHWHSPEKAVGRQVPDALWRCSTGVVAVEFDSGSYSRARIAEKAVIFQGYADQVWGSPSPQRNKLIADILERHQITGRVVLARWC